MRVFGLIGYPLQHSFSKKYFTEKFFAEKINETVYENFELEKIEDFPALLKSQPDLQGLNVTIPYKESVMQFLDEIDDEAKEIGAVNTIKIMSGRTKGFNTDHIGFLRSLMPLLKPFHKKALILGTGGSSKALKYALKKAGIEFLPVSRKPEKAEIAYNEIDKELLENYLLIINTTPLGMYPKVDAAPELPYELLTSKHLIFDLIYNPEKTLFLQRGEEKGAAIKNGSEMLVRQAEESWKIWNEY